MVYQAAKTMINLLLKGTPVGEIQASHQIRGGPHVTMAGLVILLAKIRNTTQIAKDA